MNSNNLSYLNRAVYYLDMYQLTRDLDYLSAANAFMQDYRKDGGTGYENAEAQIKAHIAALEKNS